MLKTIQILSGHGKRFLLGHPWIYANEIVQSNSTKELEPGELVQVEYQGKMIATGYFNRHSLIAFRVLSRFAPDVIDVGFFIQRLKNALNARTVFYSNPYYRLVHAEADGLPGLIIDRFNDVLVVQINTQGMEKLKAPLLEALQELFDPRTVYLKNDSPSRQQEGLAFQDPVIIGQPLDTLKVKENGVDFLIELSSSQKTGWFFDHQQNRAYLAKLAHGKTVIDYFCYSGGFSIQAAKLGAAHVIGVDRSEPALQNARRSASLNQVNEICEFICRETFEDMDLRIDSGQTFEMVILDPPAFVKAKKDLSPGLKGYEKLLTKGVQLVAKNGLLAIASCSYHVKESDLKACLAKALHKNQRIGRVVQSLSSGPDHPTHPLLEESAYLKGFLVLIE